MTVKPFFWVMQGFFLFDAVMMFLLMDTRSIVLAVVFFLVNILWFTYLFIKFYGEWDTI